MNTHFAPPQSRQASDAFRQPSWKTGLALIWLVVFGFCFYQFDLPNSNPKFNRTEIWQQLPMLIVNAIDPPQPLVGDAETRQLWKLSGWRNVPQRFGLYGVTLWILAGAWGWGSLILRLIRCRVSLTSTEQLFFAAGIGLAGLSLITLGLGLVGQLNRILLSSIVMSGVGVEIFLRWKYDAVVATALRVTPRGAITDEVSGYVRWLWLAVIPFTLCYLGGAFLPEVDFDVKEYHFGGPKEWYLAGQIAFLPHNVYTSFPFLTEMLTLLAMSLYGDWYWGAIAGKGVLMTFSLLTCVGLYTAGKRWFSEWVGLWAVLIHISTPWIYRISIIAYTEGGLTFYLFAATYALMVTLDLKSLQRAETRHDDLAPQFSNGIAQISLGNAGAMSVLTGLLAGSAMACKYPGLISVTVPVGVTLVGTLWRRRINSSSIIKLTALYGIGVLLSVGPWFLKNLLETGNPVYPLAYSWFGGVDWNPELDAKWKHAHSPEHHHLSDLIAKFIDVTLKADWLSPLLFGFAPLALWAGVARTRIRLLWLYVAYLFGTWWLLTHRIDRFWVPLIPIVSLLASIGLNWSQSMVWRRVVCAVAILAITFNYAFITSSLCGYNAYLLDLSTAAQQTAKITSPEIVVLNRTLPPDSKVLCVGEAELFDARFAYVYNTVFDQSLFESWLGQDSPEPMDPDRPFKPTSEMRQIFRERKIKHVLVNWQEILRYRTTYGYTNFVTPKRFIELQRCGILGPSWSGTGQQLLEKTAPAVRHEIENWGPELIVPIQGQPAYQTFQIFTVTE